MDESAFVLTATPLGKVESIALDDAFVYWTDAGDNVMRIAKTGGSFTVLASGQSKPKRIAVDATHVYWTSNLGGSVMRVPKAGGVASVVAAASEPWGIAVDAGFVYWANGVDKTIRRAPTTGGASTVLTTVTGVLSELAVDATHAYFFDWGPNYVVDVSHVSRVPKSGGISEAVVNFGTSADPYYPGWIALSATEVFYSRSKFGGSFSGIGRHAKDPAGASGSLPINPFVSDWMFTVEGCSLYYASTYTLHPKQTSSFGIGSGKKVDLGPPLNPIVVDATSVYGGGLNGGILTFPK